MRRLILISVACFAAGVILLIAYCNGTTNMSAGYPLSGVSLHLDITTSGVPALLGVPLTLAGAFLLIVTWFVALFTRKKRTVEKEPALPGDDRPKI